MWSFLGGLAGGFFKGLAQAAVGAFNSWLMRRRVEQLGDAKASLRYEKRAREAENRMRKQRPPGMRGTLKRLRDGSF